MVRDIGQSNAKGTRASRFTPVGVLSTPEPSTWALMLIGFAGLGFAGYRASRRAAAVA